MNRQSRRAFIAALTAVGGGCLGSRQSSTGTDAPDSDGDGVPDYGDDYPDDDRRAFRSFHTAGTVTLDRHQFSAVALTNSPQASGDVLHYDIAVEGHTPIDCLVLEREAYDAYEGGARNIAMVSEYSRVGVTETTLTRTLDQGEYVFSLDYTGLITEPGKESVTVNRLLELSKPLNGD